MWVLLELYIAEGNSVHGKILPHIKLCREVKKLRTWWGFKYVRMVLRCFVNPNWHWKLEIVDQVYSIYKALLSVNEIWANCVPIDLDWAWFASNLVLLSSSATWMAVAQENYMWALALVHKARWCCTSSLLVKLNKYLILMH